MKTSQIDPNQLQRIRKMSESKQPSFLMPRNMTEPDPIMRGPLLPQKPSLFIATGHAAASQGKDGPTSPGATYGSTNAATNAATGNGPSAMSPASPIMLTSPLSPKSPTNGAMKAYLAKPRRSAIALSFEESDQMLKQHTDRTKMANLEMALSLLSPTGGDNCDTDAALNGSSYAGEAQRRGSSSGHSKLLSAPMSEWSERVFDPDDDLIETDEMDYDQIHGILPVGNYGHVPIEDDDE